MNLSINFQEEILKSIIDNKSNSYLPIWAFELKRTEKFGKTNKSYYGRSYSRDICLIIFNYLLVNYIKVDKIEYHKTEKYYYLNFNSDRTLTSDWHSFLVCYKDNKEYIIDGSYKSLFMIHRGYVDKWFSEYAEKIFSLPPIFVGTREELNTLKKEMEEIRKLDKLHKDDEIPDWHSDSKIAWSFQNHKLWEPYYGN